MICLEYRKTNFFISDSTIFLIILVSISEKFVNRNAVYYLPFAIHEQTESAPIILYDRRRHNTYQRENQYTRILLQTTTTFVNEKRAESVLHKDQGSLGKKSKDDLRFRTRYINVGNTMEKLFPNRDKLRASRNFISTSPSSIFFY